MEDESRISEAKHLNEQLAAVQPRHILLIGGLSQSLINFRGPLIQAMLAKGYRVTATAGNHDSKVAAILSHWGADYIVVPLARSGMNPFADLRSLSALVSLMQRIRPDVFIGYTIKPVTLGLIAARLARVPRRYAMITGLGYAFIEGSELKRRIARTSATLLYRVALKYAEAVIFQNTDDQYYFRHHMLSATSRTEVVGGSGVNLSHFSPAKLPQAPVILMIARILRDKGVIEFVQAARIVKATFPAAQFVLVGPLDPSPDGIPVAQIAAWVAEGVITYKGNIDDVRPEIAACKIFVLPSYREGTPRTVLEAMAIGRPIITTDTPGCRETVSRDGSNGLLVPPRNANALAEAANRLLKMPEHRLQDMGNASLRLVRERFDVQKVTAEIMRIAQLD